MRTTPSFRCARGLLAALLTLVFLAACGGGGGGSDGGGQEPPDPPSPSDAQYQRTVTVDGREHSYFLYVPSALVDDTDLPLVLSLPGGGDTAVTHEQFIQLRAKAASAGFAVLTPNGFQTTWNAGSCCVPSTTFAIDHVAVIEAMLDDAGSLIDVDPTRVFALGHSNGGMMTYRLACELSDRIAAIASNAAVMMDRNLDTGVQAYTCDPGRPVPVLAIFGLADRCTPYEGGVSAGAAGGTRPPASETIAFWRQNNGCSVLTPTRQTTGAATCTNYGLLCRQGADVQVCTIEGAGHIWPGRNLNPAGATCGGTASTDLNANDHIWAFFAAHPMR